MFFCFFWFSRGFFAFLLLQDFWNIGCLFSIYLLILHVFYVSKKTFPFILLQKRGCIYLYNICIYMYINGTHFAHEKGRLLGSLPLGLSQHVPAAAPLQMPLAAAVDREALLPGAASGAN